MKILNIIQLLQIDRPMYNLLEFQFVGLTLTKIIFKLFETYDQTVKHQKRQKTNSNFVQLAYCILTQLFSI